MISPFARNAIVLGVLSAVGPFSIDMYLPAFPTIARDLGVSVGEVQMSLTSFFAAVAMCQMIYGPVSDRIGRKRPLYFGLATFIAGAVGCGFSTSIEALIGFRFLMGVGACAGMVVTRAIIRDLHTGPQAARLMSSTMLVFSVSPMLAPLAGSLLIEVLPWRSIFWAIVAIGVLALGVAVFFLTETRPEGARATGSAGEVLAGYLDLLRDRHFLGLVFIGGMGQASFFAYLAASSVIFIEHYGLSPTSYSAVFASNAAAFIGGAQFNSYFMRRIGAERLVQRAVIGYAAITWILLCLNLAGLDNAVVLWGFLFSSWGCLGLVIPSSTVLALEAHGARAGTASALMGTLQLATGALTITTVSFLFDGTALTMVAAIAFCSLVTLILSRVVLGRSRARP